MTDPRLARREIQIDEALEFWEPLYGRKLTREEASRSSTTSSASSRSCSRRGARILDLAQPVEELDSAQEQPR